MWAHLKSSRLWASQESRKFHGPNAILHEVTQLYSVSDRLDSLAEQHPHVLISEHSSPSREAFETRQLCWRPRGDESGAFRTGASKRLTLLIAVWGALACGIAERMRL
jgi:hypothetical protein